MLAVGLDLLCLSSRSPEVVWSQFLGVLIAEELLERLGNPLLVFDTRRCVPTVQAVEFNADSIALTALKECVIRLSYLFKWVQTPANTHSDEAEYG